MNAIEQEKELSPVNRFKTQQQAVNFLLSQGYKVSMGTFNSHLQQGHICKNEEGFFHKSALLGYAINFLKSTVIEGDVRGFDAQIQKTTSDAELKQVKAERERIRLLKEQGLIMLIAEHEEALAARALFFKQEIQSFIHRKADEIIEVCGGNEKTYDKLVHWWEIETADWLDAWSDDRDFSVSEEDENLFDEIDVEV